MYGQPFSIVAGTEFLSFDYFSFYVVKVLVKSNQPIFRFAFANLFKSDDLP